MFYCRSIWYELFNFRELIRIFYISLFLICSNLGLTVVFKIKKNFLVLSCHVTEIFRRRTCENIKSDEPKLVCPPPPQSSDQCSLKLNGEIPKANTFHGKKFIEIGSGFRKNNPPLINGRKCPLITLFLAIPAKFSTFVVHTTTAMLKHVHPWHVVQWLNPFRYFYPTLCNLIQNRIQNALKSQERRVL